MRCGQPRRRTHGLELLCLKSFARTTSLENMKRLLEGLCPFFMGISRDLPEADLRKSRRWANEFYFDEWKAPADTAIGEGGQGFAIS